LYRIVLWASAGYRGIFLFFLFISVFRFRAVYQAGCTSAFELTLNISVVSCRWFSLVAHVVVNQPARVAVDDCRLDARLRLQQLIATVADGKISRTIFSQSPNICATSEQTEFCTCQLRVRMKLKLRSFYLLWICCGFCCNLLQLVQQIHN